MNVLFVANGSQHHVPLLCTAEFIVERKYTNVTRAMRRLLSLEFAPSHESPPEAMQTLCVLYMT